MRTRSLTQALVALVLSATAFAGCNDKADTCASLGCEVDHRICIEGDDATDAICGECLDGFTLDGNACVDINECEEIGADLCHSTEICVNTPGAHECQCEDGFRNHGDGCELIIDQISLGREHICAIANGALYCWGENYDGQLGIGDSDNRDRPVRVGTRTDWDQVSSGGYHTCAIAKGELYCWGGNSDKQVGAATEDMFTTPLRVHTERTWDRVITGGYHTCALSQGELYCWGDNEYGQLGIDRDDITDTHEPTRVGSAQDWESVASGDSHTCAITQGKLYCWGYNDSNQITPDHTDDVFAPMLRDDEQVWTKVQPGDEHTCAFADQTLYCWGDNEDGQLGNETPNQTSEPLVVLPETAWTDLSTVGNHTCAITNQQLYCWGRNAYGQLAIGDEDNDRHGTPLQVPGDQAWDAVVTSRYSTCGLSDGRLFCWGDGDSGKLGQGTEENLYVPTRVEFP